MLPETELRPGYGCHRSSLSRNRRQRRPQWIRQFGAGIATHCRSMKTAPMYGLGRLRGQDTWPQGAAGGSRSLRGRGASAGGLLGSPAHRHRARRQTAHQAVALPARAITPARGVEASSPVIGPLSELSGIEQSCLLNHRQTVPPPDPFELASTMHHPCLGSAAVAVSACHLPSCPSWSAVVDRGVVRTGAGASTRSGRSRIAHAVTMRY